MTERQLTIIEALAAAVERSDHCGMDLPINRAKVIRLELRERGYKIVRDVDGERTTGDA